MVEITLKICYRVEIIIFSNLKQRWSENLEFTMQHSRTIEAIAGKAVICLEHNGFCLSFYIFWMFSVKTNLLFLLRKYIVWIYKYDNFLLKWKVCLPIKSTIKNNFCKNKVMFCCKKTRKAHEEMLYTVTCWFSCWWHMKWSGIQHFTKPLQINSSIFSVPYHSL